MIKEGEGGGVVFRLGGAHRLRLEGLDLGGVDDSGLVRRGRSGRRPGGAQEDLVEDGVVLLLDRHFYVV